ncbi:MULTISPECIES: nitrous oxide reductase family maturation protein NosD [Billgrantia]|uniref:Nitrous oxide reductase family maturation protein NosD n=2 Tax=Billgrantia TaxID=3137761 RepID=A0ABS9A7Z4_9GAMM|nr:MULTISPECIES: nitrous oxide reductase family maturation protein NosD [Halomonas]MCE8004672.1 nitrous oxide reductase family maturation protein NosD [Halomonas ethanolica]MCE8043716.1 nitrous oxide reductase family maturation protein NosD [Halomonas desiderata]MCE8048290.1 nitrous oxide reductase family maturation protein NosD [Halomonas desiderata]
MQHTLFSFLGGCALLLTATFAFGELRIEPGDGPLQAHIDTAAPGSELTLAAGIHIGGILIDKPLTLRGEPGAILDGEGSGDVIRVRAPDVRIEGLTLRNSGFNLTDMNAGIHAEREAHRIHVENNVMENVAFGVWAWHLEAPSVIGNRIAGNTGVRSQDRGDAIRLYNISGGTIADNDVRDSRDAIYVDTSRDLTFRNNRLRDSRFGIHYMFTHGGKIVGNHTSGTRAGYALMMSRDLEVVNNRSERDMNYGILMNYVNYSTIAGNDIRGITAWHGPGGSEHGVTLGAEGKALFIYNSQRNEIHGNRLADSEMGIHLTAGSENNRLYANAFINNRQQVMYVATRHQEWSRDGRGNYWSDYLGWDLDGDGVGDTPYEPNDAVDRLLWRHPEARLLLHSPAVVALRWVQRQFPIFRAQGVQDSAPLMHAPDLGEAQS